MSRPCKAKSTHARVRGREELAKRTVWYVELGALRFRCVLRIVNPLGVSRYEVQHRQEGVWSYFGAGNDPQLLLRRVVGSNVAGLALEHKATLAAEDVGTPTEPAEDVPG